MIRVELEPLKLTLNETSPVTLRFTNLANTPCTNLVFRLGLPAQLLLLRGQDQIDIARLNPGQTVSVTLHLRARGLGNWSLTAANFSYRDARGIPQRITDLRLPLQVESAAVPVLDPTTDLVRKAQALEAGGHPDEAWRLYLEAHSFQIAGEAFKRAVAEFTQAGRHAEAAQHCEEWANAALKRAGGHTISDADAAAWLDQAAELFSRASDHLGKERCREQAARVMETPRFRLELEAPSGAQFIIGRSTRIIVKITNQGYGPAREVRLRLTGDMEEPHPEHVLTDLLIGETRDWTTARVIPRRPGDMLLRLEVYYRTYRDNCSGSAVIEHFIPVMDPDPTGMFGDIARGGAPVHVHIEKLVGSGAVNNEVSIYDSVVVGRAPLVNASAVASGDVLQTARTDQAEISDLPISPSSGANVSGALGSPAQTRLCLRCRIERPDNQSPCPNCGAVG